MLNSARTIGALLLAVPVLVVVASTQFPSYDARSEFFVGTYHNIVESGSSYLVSLLLFLLIAATLALLAAGLWRSPLADATGFLWVVIGGLGASSAGFAVTGLAGLPVWRWARQATDGTLTVLEAADHSSGMAAFSQTILLTIAFGGLLIGMSALGVMAVVQGWVPRWLFWATIAAAVGAVVFALATDGPALWVGFGLLPMLWAVVLGGVLLILGERGLVNADLLE